MAHTNRASFSSLSGLGEQLVLPRCRVRSCWLALFVLAMWAGPAFSGHMEGPLVRETSADLSMVRDCTSVQEQLPPDRIVLQIIEETFHKWREYDLGGGEFCIILDAPHIEVLTQQQARSLLEVSARWMVVEPEADQIEILDPEDPSLNVPPAMPPRTYDPARREIERDEPDTPAEFTFPDAEPSGVAKYGSYSPQVVIGDDDRVRITSTTQFPWRTIAFQGMTYPNDTSARCTAFLIAPHVALTNAHCVYRSARGGFASSVSIAPGQRQDVDEGLVIRPYGLWSASDWETNQQYIDNEGTSAAYQYDYASSHYTASFSNVLNSTYMPLVFDISPSEGSEIHLAGYPATAHGVNTSAMWHSTDAVHSVQGRLLAYLADTSGGNSGGPVWQQFFTPTIRRIVAIHGYGFPSGGYNFGPRLVWQNQPLIENWMNWGLPSRGLEVELSGTGSGVVSSHITPGGISCPGTCSGNFANNSSVTLAQAPSEGSSFGGWSGACSGYANTCTVLMNELQSVGATFNLAEFGTLSGHITEADGNPAFAALLKIVSQSTSAVFYAFTDGLGHYSRLLAEDTYDVTVSYSWHLPKTVAGLVIEADESTVLDVELEPAPTWQVTGQVTDAATGWPLYASIEVLDFNQKVWTDPVDGTYSISLQGGFEFSLAVRDWDDNYISTTRSVGPLTDHIVEDFLLEADLDSCSAPGYRKEYLYYEDFSADDGGFVIDGPAPAPWQWGAAVTWPFECGERSNCWGTNHVGNYNDDADEAIVSPIIDLSGIEPGTSLTARWLQAWETESNAWDQATAEVRFNQPRWAVMWENDNTWEEVEWTEMSYDLSAAAGSSDVQFRFRLVTDDWVNGAGYYVDALRIFEGDECKPAPGGLVVGHVYDDNTGEPLNGAMITDSTTGSVTHTVPTPDYPNVDDAFFLMFVPEGSTTLTVFHAGGYAEEEVVLNMSNGATIEQSFWLPAGHLHADPASVDVTVLLGTETTVPLTLQNSGNLAAEFQIVELEDETIAQDQSVAGLGPATTDSMLLDVLIVYADIEEAEPLRSILEGYSDLDVDIWLATGSEGSIPPPAVLQDYHVVITWSSGAGGANYVDRNLMGDVLADYVDGGGTVIQAVFNWTDDSFIGLGGRFVSDNYSPFVNINGGHHSASADLGTYDPGHPLMEGVSSASDSFRNVVDLNPEATLVASWDDGEQFVAHLGRVVAINSYPGFYSNWSGDVGQIFYNAVTFLAAGDDVAWLDESPKSGTLEAKGSQSIELHFNADVPEVDGPGLYNATLRIHNTTPYGSLDVPVTMHVVDEDFAIQLDPTTSSALADPGQTVIYSLRVGNAGTAVDTFDVSLSGHAWTTGVSSTSLTLDPEESEIFEVNVDIPLEAGDGATDSVLLTIESTADPLGETAVTATLTTGVSLLLRDRFEAEP